MNRKTISGAANVNHTRRIIKNIAWFYEDDIRDVSDSDLHKMIDIKFKEKKKSANSGSFQRGQQWPGPAKRILLIDLEKDKKLEFRSISKASSYLGCSSVTIRKLLSNTRCKYSEKFKAILL